MNKLRLQVHVKTLHLLGDGSSVQAISRITGTSINTVTKLLIEAGTAGAAVVKAVSIPVIGGFGGGPWLDGRVRMAHTAIGYAERWIDAKAETYANVARSSLDAFTALIGDVRAGRQIKG